MAPIVSGARMMTFNRPIAMPVPDSDERLSSKTQAWKPANAIADPTNRSAGVCKAINTSNATIAYPPMYNALPQK